jgi:hypothetical protein
VARNSIETFHIVNLTEAINFITTGAGASCGTVTGTNAVPVISALTNYSIPFNTPFSLTALATDGDNDPLTTTGNKTMPAPPLQITRHRPTMTIRLWRFVR